jgi:hypothetical protein
MAIEDETQCCAKYDLHGGWNGVPRIIICHIITFTGLNFKVKAHYALGIIRQKCMIVLFVIFIYLIGIKNMATHSVDGDWLCDVINDVFMSYSWLPTPIAWSLTEHEKFNNNNNNCVLLISRNVRFDL